MHIRAQSLTIIALAAGALLLPPPIDGVAALALALVSLMLAWTRQRALERCAQGVADRLDTELGEVIAEVNRRRERATTD